MSLLLLEDPISEKAAIGMGARVAIRFNGMLCSDVDQLELKTEMISVSILIILYHVDSRKLIELTFRLWTVRLIPDVANKENAIFPRFLTKRILWDHL